MQQQSNLTSGWAESMPAKQALYDPSQERDACGVGFIINIKGQASHQLLRDSESLLCNMSHRGATGADQRDGDGAGVMTGIPHKLLEREFQNLGCKLPAQGQYAVGNVFMNPDSQVRQATIETFEDISKQMGLTVAAWRRVPVDAGVLGPASASREPSIVQPLVVPSVDMPEVAFQRLLYVLRKRAQHALRDQDTWFYVCSLATRHIVYKGQLTPAQVPEYYADLRDEAFETHFTLVHSRFSTNTFPSWERAQPFHYSAHNGKYMQLVDRCCLYDMSTNFFDKTYRRNQYFERKQELDES